MVSIRTTHNLIAWNYRLIHLTTLLLFLVRFLVDVRYNAHWSFSLTPNNTNIELVTCEDWKILYCVWNLCKCKLIMCSAYRYPTRFIHHNTNMHGPPVVIKYRHINFALRSYFNFNASFTLASTNKLTPLKSRIHRYSASSIATNFNLWKNWNYFSL
jgi:hypothetical protein